MNDNILKIVDIYCKEEMNGFKMDNYYKELFKLTQKLNLKLVCDVGKLEREKKYFLSVSIINQNNEIIEIFDEGFLVASTMLILVDKKERTKFFSWRDDDFIDSLRWLIKELEIIKNKK